MTVSIRELRQHIGYHTAWWRVSSPTAHRRSPSPSRPAYRLASVPTLLHWSLRPVHCYTGHSVLSTATLVTPSSPLLHWSLRSIHCYTGHSVLSTATLVTPSCPLLHWSLRPVQCYTSHSVLSKPLHSSLRSVHCYTGHSVLSKPLQSSLRSVHCYTPHSVLSTATNNYNFARRFPSKQTEIITYGTLHRQSF